MTVTYELKAHSRYLDIIQILKIHIMARKNIS